MIIQYNDVMEVKKGKVFFQHFYQYKFVLWNIRNTVSDSFTVWNLFMTVLDILGVWNLFMTKRFIPWYIPPFVWNCRCHIEIWPHGNLHITSTYMGTYSYHRWWVNFPWGGSIFYNRKVTRGSVFYGGQYSIWHRPWRAVTGLVGQNH